MLGQIDSFVRQYPRTATWLILWAAAVAIAVLL